MQSLQKSESSDIKPEINLTDSLENISFMHKLWIIINSNSSEAIKWNPINPKTILINFTRLEPLLLTKFGFLEEKSSLDFLHTLFAQGFRKHIKFETSIESNNYTPEIPEKIFSSLTSNSTCRSVLNQQPSRENSIQNNCASSSFGCKLEDEDSAYFSSNKSSQLNSQIIEPDFEEFKHGCFQRGRYDLIGKAEKRTNEGDVVLPLINQANPNPEATSTVEHSPDDLVCKKIPQLSKLQIPRLILQTNLQFQKNQLVLNLGLTESNSSNKKESVIKLPADSFESSWESISGFVESSEYAGFYGSAVQTDKIKAFFGEYLPVYVQNSLEENEAETPMEEEAENGHESRTEQNIDSANEDTLTSLPNKDEDIIEMSTPKTLEPMLEAETPSKLKPESSYQADDDISMDELLKFNTKLEQADLEESIDKTDESSTYENSIPKSIEDFDENKENTFIVNLNASTKENDFQSFLTQYRDTLNVLYENTMN